MIGFPTYRLIQWSFTLTYQVHYCAQSIRRIQIPIKTMVHTSRFNITVQCLNVWGSIPQLASPDIGLLACKLFIKPSFASFEFLRMMSVADSVCYLWRCGTAGWVQEKKIARDTDLGWTEPYCMLMEWFNHFKPPTDKWPQDIGLPKDPLNRWLSPWGLQHLGVKCL